MIRWLAFSIGIIPAAGAVAILFASVALAVPLGILFFFFVWSAARLGVPGFTFSWK